MRGNITRNLNAFGTWIVVNREGCWKKQKQRKNNDNTHVGRVIG